MAGAWQAFLDAIPLANTLLVAMVGVLILLGIWQIRAGHVARHRALMLAATGTFTLFLLLYTIRLVVEGPTGFHEASPNAPSWGAPFYYSFLVTHMLLALATVVLIPVLLTRAFKKRFADHKRLARKVAPMWLVSIAMGIGVYIMLYQVWQ